MKNNIMIMNFSGVYEMQGLKTALEKKVDSVVAEAENMAAKPVITQLDFQDIPGTNCYCDSLAEEEIGKRIIPFGPEGLHFLDSGNYHYLTKLWLELVKEPFELLVFDHHTDMQPPALLPVLSCGSWIRDAAGAYQNIKGICVIGPPEALVRETEAMEHVWFVTQEELDDGSGAAKIKEVFASHAGTFPVYLSVDKDILSKEELDTNWDQGNVVLDQVLQFIDVYMQQTPGRQFIGMDICGEDPEADNEEVQTVCRKTSEKICGFFLC